MNVHALHEPCVFDGTKPIRLLRLFLTGLEGSVRTTVEGVRSMESQDGSGGESLLCKTVFHSRVGSQWIRGTSETERTTHIQHEVEQLGFDVIIRIFNV